MAEQPFPFAQNIDFDSIDTDAIVQRVRAIVEPDMQIESIEVPREPQYKGLVVLRGRLLRPSYEVFTGWLNRLHALGYTPTLHSDPEATDNQVILRVIAGVVPKTDSRVWINVLLFILTVLSTLFFGAQLSDEQPARTLSELVQPQNLILGWPFVVTLLGILSFHEFGHYFAARYHNVAVSLPYFLPMPFGFGTLGAFIRMKELVPDQRKLFDIGIAGPLAGLVVALPLLFYGLSTSPIDVPPPGSSGQIEGNSILYYYAKYYVFGKVLPNPVTGEDVFMNQVTFASWIGLLVTALNLLPIGQLDGGHTVFALFGRRAQYINLATAGVMALLAIAGLQAVQQYYPPLEKIGFSGWFLWLGLIFFLIGPFHPPALDDVTKLNRGRRWLGYLVILIFILTFVPVPMRCYGPNCF